MHRNRAATTPVEDHLWQAFGLRLRQWRRRAGLTQAQLGAEIGYDHTAVSNPPHQPPDRRPPRRPAAGRRRTARRLPPRRGGPRPGPGPSLRRHRRHP
ncbi:helix-turn-helix transcriptional regulator, partial [Streptomyces sp. NRRL S-495]|uniref:helix-turn-helix domain-containing protein n=1 Tax=Streptomyces sp. NRRL S-495 TaxID=1609133 RepID=UPI0025704197